MARDRANVWTDIWADSDWRNLSGAAQRLYLLILTHPTLTYAGVADWRPNRVAMMSADGTVEGLNAAAGELEENKFIVVDEETEEVLIRSFVKHDGLMKSPNLAAALAREYGNVYSKRIREVVAFEVQKLHRNEPELKGWGRVGTLLSEPSRNVFEEGSGNPSVDPSPNPSGNPSVKGLANPSVNPSPTSTSTSTSTYYVGAHTPDDGNASGVPEGWKPNKKHYDLGRETGVYVKGEAEKFRQHAADNKRELKNVNLAFTNWLKTAEPSTKPSPTDLLWTKKGPF